MPNLRKSEVGFKPIVGRAVLADGLMAIARPGSEVESQLASSLFKISDVFRQKAEATAVRKGAEAGKAMAAANIPQITINGGDRTYGSAPSADPLPSAASEGHAPAATAGGNVAQTIAAAAGRHGVPASFLMKVAQIESGYDPGAKNPYSSAGGLFQQTDGNAAQYGVSNRFDAGQSADGAARFARDNINALTKRLGRAPTEGELYLAHQQGGGGAAALLSNPGARAVDIVGRDAVLANGGDLSMSAGAFAAKWTSKFDGTTVTPVEMNSMGPIVGRAPLSITASGGDLQVTGRDSLYGRSFDDAAAHSYMSQLTDEMLTASSQLSDKYKDDPAGLAFAFTQLKEAQLNEHVPDVIKSDYLLAFAKIERSHLATAQKQLDAKIEQGYKDEYAAKGDRVLEEFSRAQAGFDPGVPETETLMQAQAARLKDHLSEGVARGWITQQQAAEQAARIDGDVAVTAWLAKSDGRTPEEIDTLRTVIKEDYAAGKIKGLDARAFEKLDAALEARGRDVARADAAASSTLTNTAKDLVTRAAEGYKIPAAEITKFQQLASTAPEGDAIVSSTMEILDLAETLRDQPIDVAAAKVEKMRAALGPDATARESAKVEAAEAMVAAARKSIATDLLGYAERMGVIESAGSVGDAETPGDIEKLMQGRVAAAATAAEHFGVRPQYFRPGEMKMIEDMMRGSPETGAAIGAAVLKGAGPQARTVLLSFGKAAPMVLASGAIIIDGGDMTAASDAIAGSGKNADGQPYSNKGWQQRQLATRDAIGNSLSFQSEDAARVTSAAEWISRKRIADAGVEPDSQEAMDIHAKAINEAAGAVYENNIQWGGFASFDPGWGAAAHQVVVPNSIRADKLGDLLDAVRADDVAVQPVGGIDVIHDYWPVLTGNGYVFVDYNMDGTPVPLMGEDQKPFVLNIDKLAPRLGPRVRGAIRGY